MFYRIVWHGRVFCAFVETDIYIEIENDLPPRIYCLAENVWQLSELW